MRKPAMTHRSTASFGKRQESIAVAELLRRGFAVYMTLVDDQQIDCIISRGVCGLENGRRGRITEDNLNRRSSWMQRKVSRC
jgi:hypothetical protein